MTVTDRKTIFDSYPGGKNVNGTYHKIINQIPPHDIYVEPFIGGGAILRRKRPASMTVGSDLDTGVCKAWADYQMEGLEVHNQDALQTVQNVLSRNPGRRVFVYFDPPYRKEDRSSSQDIYNCESSPELHDSILKFIPRLNCDCMISTYPNALYAEKLKDWRYFEYESITRGGMATEALYMNYQEPTELHDYQYLGTDCWDRQRIKRKISRKIVTLSKLPILEQRAIILGMNEAMAIKDKNNYGGSDK